MYSSIKNTKYIFYFIEHVGTHQGNPTIYWEYNKRCIDICMSFLIHTAVNKHENILIKLLIKHYIIDLLNLSKIIQLSLNWIVHKYNI